MPEATSEPRSGRGVAFEVDLAQVQPVGSALTLALGLVVVRLADPGRSRLVAGHTGEIVDVDQRLAGLLATVELGRVGADHFELLGIGRVHPGRSSSRSPDARTVRPRPGTSLNVE